MEGQGTAEKLAELSKKHARQVMVAKKKDGSHVIYISPQATDITGLLMTVCMEIDNGLKR